MTTDQDQENRRRIRARNLATLAALVFLVILLYLVAIVRMSGAA